MKKLLTTILGLIMTLPSFCQTDTITTNQPDTTITNPYQMWVVPKYIMLNVVRDLKDYDLVKKENIELKVKCYNQLEKNAALDSAIKAKSYLLNRCQNDYEDSQNIQLSYKLRLDKVEAKSSRKDGWIKGLGTALIISILTNIILH